MQLIIIINVFCVINYKKGGWLGDKMLSSCYFSPPKTHILKIGNYPSPPQFNCFALRLQILLGSPLQTANDSWARRKKDMLFQLNQTWVIFKVEKNQLSAPNSQPFPLWVQQQRYNTAFIKSAGQSKSRKAFCVRRHSDPSSKMPYSFFFFNLAGFLHACWNHGACWLSRGQLWLHNPRKEQMWKWST